MLIPPFGEPYADYATAEAAITDETIDCYGFISAIAGTLDSASVDVSTANEVNVDAAVTDDAQAFIDIIVSVTVDTGSELSVAYSVSSSGSHEEDEETIATVIVKDCNGTTVYTDQASEVGGGPVAGTFVFGPFAAGGVYYVTLSGAGASVDTPTTTTTVSFDLTNDSAMVPNPVVALWDDSGTTRQLEACPKMLLPPLTESTGTWYADCPEAAGVLTDADQVSNCVGFTDYSPIDSFTATDGGTSLTLSVTTAAPPPGVAYLYGSVNAEAGETITVTASGSADPGFSIYDYAGVLVEYLPPMASTPSQTSSALPYTGKYIIAVEMTGLSITTWTAAITSSGTLSVNPIAARYDASLDCPALLLCGDACP